MAKLDAKARGALSSTTFGLPGSRKYPMPDKSHASNAKARATQQFDAGKLTSAQKVEIDAKANKKLMGGNGSINHKPGCGGNHLGDCPSGY